MLQTFSDPALTAYESAATAEAERQAEFEKNDEDVPEPAMPQEARDLVRIVETYGERGSPTPHHAAWIEAAETVPSLLDNGLRYLLTQQDRTGKDSVDCLFYTSFKPSHHRYSSQHPSFVDL